MAAGMPEALLSHIYNILPGTGHTEDYPVRTGDQPPWDQDFYAFQDYLDSEEYEEGVFVKFGQSEFVPAGSEAESTLAEHGWLYYPNTCTDGGCKLVVVMHGAHEPARNLALPTAGWIQVAHLNNLIVLLPQLAGGAWEDSIDPDAGTKAGVVETAIMAMVARVTEALDAERAEDGNYF